MTTALGSVPRRARRSVRSPLKWHGGKYYLASRIVRLMPPHLHYVEPFAGGMSVLFARNPEGTSEVVNDLNGRLTNFWRVLQDPKLFARFRRRVEAIPLSRTEWEAAHDHVSQGDAVAGAAAFFVDCRQSRSGLMERFTSITRGRTRLGMNGNVSEWLSAVDGLPEVHLRLRRVLVECLPAVDLIEREDGPETLFYCDPPYVHETRTTTTSYEHEMTTEDHERLLASLRSCKGRVMLSGYPSDLYDSALRDWTRYVFEVPNHSAGGRKKAQKTEVLWCNFPPDVAEQSAPTKTSVPPARRTGRVPA